MYKNCLIGKNISRAGKKFKVLDTFLAPITHGTGESGFQSVRYFALIVDKDGIIGEIRLTGPHVKRFSLI